MITPENEATLLEACLNNRVGGACALECLMARLRTPGSHISDLGGYGIMIGLSLSECYGIMDGWDTESCRHAFFGRGFADDGDEYDAGEALGRRLFAATMDRQNGLLIPGNV